jgi:hypothetical protein
VIVAAADSSGNELAADFPAAGGADGKGADGGVENGASCVLSQCGQTHSTVHFRIGTSLTHGIFTRCLTSWMRHLQSSLQPHLSQQRVTPGTQMESQLHVYCHVVSFLVVHSMWHSGTSLQPQCGQQWQHASPAIAGMGACPANGTPQSKASAMIGKNDFVMFIFPY